MLCLLDGVFPIPISTIVPPRRKLDWSLTLSLINALRCHSVINLCHVVSRCQKTQTINTRDLHGDSRAVCYCCCYLFLFFAELQSQATKTKKQQRQQQQQQQQMLAIVVVGCLRLVALRLLHELVKRESRSLVWPAVSRSDWQSNSWASQTSRQRLMPMPTTVSLLSGSGCFSKVTKRSQCLLWKHSQFGGRLV